MNWSKKYWAGVLVLFGVAGGVTANYYESAPYERYQPILERMPFGALPPGFNPNAEEEAAEDKSLEEEQQEQQEMARHLAFTALNITPQGTIAVGFFDRSATPQENHYVEVGGSAGGWQVLFANYDENIARFKRDDITITMHLTKGLVLDKPEAQAQTNGVDVAVAQPARVPQPPTSAPVLAPRAARPRGSGLSGILTRSGSADAATGEPGPGPQSFSERLKARKAQESAAQKAAEKQARESLQQMAREIAQDELAKRDQEAALALEELRLQQELYQAQQLEAQARELQAEQEALEAAAAEAEQP